MECGKCLNCKFASNIVGCYCYCKKRYNRVQISKQNECEKFKEVLKNVFDCDSYSDVEHIPKVLEGLGYKIIYDGCERSDYQGDLYLLYRKNNKIYWFESSYGSCCCCDTWYYSTESVDKFMEIFRDEDRTTVEFDNKQELKEFIKNHYIYDNQMQDFIKIFIEKENENGINAKTKKQD